MMKNETLGGKNTAKRKIQIRRYIEERSKAMRQHSDPFVQDENDGSQVLKVGSMKFSFKTDYIASDDSEFDDEQHDYGILTKKLDLNEADRFMASLRMPKAKAKKHSQQRLPPPAPVVTVDLDALRAQSEMVEKMIMAEAVEHEEEEEVSE